MVNLPSGVDIDNLIEDLRRFSWEAADILLHYSGILAKSNDETNFLKNKNINDPVTVADLEVNNLIIKRIQEKYKGVKWEIMSEENVKIESNNFERDSDWLWILDPLDGTKDFIEGSENYAMHLGLNYKNRTFLGIVLIPEKNELWISNSHKTWCEQRDGKRILTHPPREKILHDMKIVTSKNHRNETLKKIIEKLNFKDVIVMGSIGCKISSILRGESEIYICSSLPSESSPKDWDFAAPEAILKAAGGAITNINNEELIYGGANFEQRGIIVATSNKTTHQSICLQIKQIIKEFDLFPLDS